MRQLKQNGSIYLGERTIKLEEVSKRKPGQRFALVMDTRYCTNAVVLAKQVDTLVAESTFLNQHAAEAREYRHLTSAQAATIAQQAQVKQLILTHFSPRYAESGDFVGEASEIFANVRAVKDGDCINLQHHRDW